MFKFTFAIGLFLALLASSAGFVTPFQYKVKLDVAIPEKRFYAIMQSHFAPTKRSDRIELRVGDYDVFNVKFIGSNRPRNFSFYYDRNASLVVVLDSEYFYRNKSYTLQIKYKGMLREDNTGFSYGGNYVSAEFQSKRCQMLFPCFGKSSLLVPLEIFVFDDETNTVIVSSWSNAGEASRELGYMVFDPPMVHQHALMIGKFHSKEVHSGDHLYRVYYQQEIDQESIFIVEAGSVILEGLEDILGCQYPLDKIDSVVLPGHHTADTFSLVFYEAYDEILLAPSIDLEEGIQIKYNPTISMARMHESLLTIGRKMSFQFFGGMIEREDLDGDVVDALREFMGYKVIEEAFPQFNSMDFMYLDYVQRYLWEDIRDVGFRIVGTDEKSLRMKKIVALLRMFHDMSEETLIRAIKKLLYSKTSRTHSVLQIAVSMGRQFELREPFDMLQLLDTWNASGYPFVNASRNVEKSEINLIQRNFTDGHLSNWILPIFIQFDDKTTAFDYLTRPQGVVAHFGSFLANPGQSVPYRVNYEPELWSKLIERLQTQDFGGIHHINRAQLLDDSMALAHAGYISHEIVLRLTEYLDGENHFVPWTVASRNFMYLFRKMKGTQTLLSSYIADLIEPVYDRIGITDGGNEEELGDKHLRIIAIEWACLTKNKKCLKEVDEIVKNITTDAYTELESNTRDAVCCAVMRNEIPFALKFNGNTEDERDFLIRCYSCANFTVQGFLLEDTLEETSKYLEEHEIQLYQKYFIENSGSETFRKLITLLRQSALEVQEYQDVRRKETYIRWISGLANRLNEDLEHERLSLIRYLRRISFIDTQEQLGLEVHVDRVKDDYMQFRDVEVYLQKYNLSSN